MARVNVCFHKIQGTGMCAFMIQHSLCCLPMYIHDNYLRQRKCVGYVIREARIILSSDDYKMIVAVFLIIMINVCIHCRSLLNCKPLDITITLRY